MYEDGKIWVVITIIGIIFTGIALYLFFIDRRLRKLESDFDQPDLSEDDSSQN